MRICSIYYGLFDCVFRCSFWVVQHHTNTSRIDVVVRDSKGDAFLFIECKSPYAYASEDKDQLIHDQLYKVAGMEKTEGHKVKYC